MLRQDLQGCGRRRIITIILLCVGLSVNAQLEWDTRKLSLVPAPGQDTVQAVFKFRNAGKTTIKVDRIRTSCGCTTAELTKRVYEPGESGELDASLKLGDVPGIVRKPIYVVSMDDSIHTDELEIEASIPEYLHIDPPFAVWRDASNMTPQHLLITIGEGFNFQLLGVTASNDVIQASLETLEAGRRYDLVLTPTVKEARNFTSITIQSDFPAESPMTFKTFGKVVTLDRANTQPTLWRRFLRWFAD